MIKKIHFVTKETMEAGTVLETMEVSGLDSIKFSDVIRKRFGGNRRARQALQDAIKGVNDGEVSLYVADMKPHKMVVLPDGNVVEWVKDAMKKIDGTVGDGGLRGFALFNAKELIEAVLYVMANADKFEGYRADKYDRNWQRVFNLARKYYEDANASAESIIKFVWGIARVYAHGCLNRLSKRLQRDCENYGSAAYEQAVAIMSYFMDELVMEDKKVFYKDEEGWNVILTVRVRAADNTGESGEIVYRILCSDDSGKISMRAVFDNKKFRSMNHIAEAVARNLKSERLKGDYSKIGMAIEAGMCVVGFSIPQKGYLSEVEKLTTVIGKAFIETALEE